MSLSDDLKKVSSRLRALKNGARMSYYAESEIVSLEYETERIARLMAAQEKQQ